MQHPRFDGETRERAPEDPDDAGGWDAWWRKRLQNDHLFELTNLSEITRDIVPLLHREQKRTVLSAACGIQLEVRALAAAGLTVTGMDLSRVAIEFARSFQDAFVPREHYLRPDEHRTGGSVDYRVGSFLDATLCSGPFDLVCCRSAIQYHHRAGRLDEALEALAARVAPDGVLVLTTHNAYSLERPVLRWFESHGFRMWDHPTQKEFLEPTPGRRRAWHAMSSG